jgi:hypothetical protein
MKIIQQYDEVNDVYYDSYAYDPEDISLEKKEFEEKYGMSCIEWLKTYDLSDGSHPCAPGLTDTEMIHSILDAKFLTSDDRLLICFPIDYSKNE